MTNYKRPIQVLALLGLNIVLLASSGGYGQTADPKEFLPIIPLYRCPDPDHQAHGLYAEDPDRRGWLTCGCPKRDL